MANRKTITLIIAITGIALNFVGLELMPVHIHIQLSKEDLAGVLQHCPTCTDMQGYYNLNPNVTEPIFFAGFALIGIALFLGLVFKPRKLTM
ncbi:hypothetical protein DYY67_0986 [Candidatus Nitrosotalea sp. TS]|uniref:hypothetical protein n=1 Tax=Candidatus Nitrosotalea sp. TS TaxID=2341020 RepID=UPI00140B4D2B|nr:hypothetical protein [Candidatus Nitrosotalea sp. TS]NHI03916.1 hypothetical protein [Candidatus Nitrosotalea sp. TS]